MCWSDKITVYVERLMCVDAGKSDSGVSTPQDCVALNGNTDQSVIKLGN